MPLYEYRCRMCGETFELLRRFSDADRDLICPQCRSEQIERLLSTFATTGCGPGAGAGRFT